MNKNTEITTTNNTGYLALQDWNLSDVMAEEMSGLSVSLEKIRIPHGGPDFVIPGDDPDTPDAVKEFTAVILYQHPLNAFYKEAYHGGSNPPDCGSYDGVYGTGDPGGACGNCPYNVFGSGNNGAKACKNRRRLYLLREGETFPLILSLSTGSLKSFARYLMRILPKYKNSNAVVTRLTMKTVTSRTGLAYSQVQFAVDRVLTPEEYTLVSAMSEQVKRMSAHVGYDTEEAGGVNTETGEMPEPIR